MDEGEALARACSVVELLNAAGAAIDNDFENTAAGPAVISSSRGGGGGGDGDAEERCVRLDVLSSASNRRSCKSSSARRVTASAAVRTSVEFMRMEDVASSSREYDMTLA